MALVAFVAVGLAFAAGLGAGSAGPMGLVAAIGLAIAAGAFIDLRVTLMAVVPAMVLLPELPLALPLRTEDLLMVPLAGAWLAQIAIGARSWPRTPLNLPLFAIIAVEFVALLWGSLTGTSRLTAQLYSGGFFFLKTVEVTLLFFIVVSALENEGDLRRFIGVLVASAAALGVWGVIEGMSRPAGEAIVGPTGHGGYSLLGLTLVVLTSVLVGLFLTQRSSRQRLILALAALPVLSALTFTLSRQSYVGAAAALGMIIWVRDRRLILPAMALAIALPLVVPDVVQERALSVVTAAPDPISGISPYATRFHAVQRRLPEVLTGSPVLGFGLAALPPGFLDNQYLLTLYYTGLVGLGVFLWLLWRAWITAYRSYRSTAGALKGLPLAWLAATAGLAIAGLAGSPFVAVRVRQVYWFLAALALVAVRVARRDAVAEEAARQPGEARRPEEALS